MHFKDSSQVDHYDYVMVGQLLLAKDMLPRLAAKFDAGMASDCT
jgi:electron transfer flavoprotein alpha subunit